MEQKKGIIRLRLPELMKAKSHRDGERITGNRVAKATCVSRQTVKNYIDNQFNNPDYLWVMKLCRYFECTVDELIEFEQA